MFKTFSPESRRAVADARAIAVSLGSPTLEAEHILLAISRRPGNGVQGLLAGAGLDEDALRDALAAEFEGSLAVVGVSVPDEELRSTVDRSRAPRWGASATLALRRGAKIADARRDRRFTPAHIVLGILRASAGTVPRALDRAGWDRVELSARLEAAL
jgi:ATP-dependent Clp protease ATP-binding subunit ClpA